MKKLLILEDRYPHKDKEINLGDRALYAGLHKGLQPYFSEIISGPVKTFPYFTINKFRKDATILDVEAVFDSWFKKVVSYSSFRAKVEGKLIHVLENSFLFTNTIFQRCNKKFEKKFTRGILDTLRPYVFRHYYAHQLISKVKEADIVLFNGGGLICDKLSKYVPMPLFELYVAHRLGKKVLVANQTVSIEKQPTFNVVSFVYRVVAKHNVREALSKDVLNKLGVPSRNILVSCDAAFASTPSSEEKIKEIVKKERIKKDQVAIVVRGDRQVDMLQWGKTVHYIQKNLKKDVYFIHTNESHDKKVADELIKKWNVKKLSHYYNYPEVIGLLKHFSFVLTDRYHAAVFSILAETPVITFDTVTIKLKGMMEMINYPVKMVGSITDNEAVNERIHLVLEQKSKLRPKLAAIKKKYTRKFLQDMKKLASYT